ncbi:MAG: transposase, partial [Verrucomicrobiota bacterium]
FTNLLFAAAWETLKELLADPKYLGALPGALASFHSWAQSLWVHPHLHVLVTGGGMTPSAPDVSCPGFPSSPRCIERPLPLWQ